MESQAAEKAAQKFLKTGNLQGYESNELALACDRLVQQAARRSIKRALTIAHRFAASAEVHGGVLALTAYRALARVTHMGGAHADALSAYRKARHLAGRDRLVSARIDRALIDVYMYLGRFKDSERAARRAQRALIMY